MLGDATGELGTFYSYKDSDNTTRRHSIWGRDHAVFVDSSNPWFVRGGAYYAGTVAGSFAFYYQTGAANIYISFRLVLN